MAKKSLNQAGFSLIEGLLLVIAVALVAFVGYYIYHSQSQVNKTYNAAAQVSQTSPSKSDAVNSFATCEKSSGSITQESFPETCVTKAGKSFTDTNQKAPAAPQTEQ